MTVPSKVSIYPSGKYGAPELCLYLKMSPNHIPCTICDWKIGQSGENQEKTDLKYWAGLITFTMLLFLR